ncbi:ATP-binding protein [uncultured Nostoc sp.]|uniref:ATP-binding protein n=1 Tax=uncultured Nostoc sp. TaxID=340711 RepID=UPI0035C99CE3
MNQTLTSPQNYTAELIQVDKALESMRDSGFDLATAGGEVIDNSIEAKAQFIRIRTVEGTVANEVTMTAKSKTKFSKAIKAIAFADDGIGIPYDTLPHVLTLGFSTRYNQRDGLGRFGVGMKLAAISQARRIDIYTQPLGSNQIFHAYLDLDLVASGEQVYIQGDIVDAYPPEYNDLMQHPKKGTAFESGTLVIWSKVDRLTEGGKYGSSLDERRTGFIKLIARAYRKFIDQGLYIEINQSRITLHDPLFLLENPRVTQNFGRDLRAEIIQQTKPGEISIDGHEVQVTVTLYPEEFRKKRGLGGRGSRDEKEKFEDLNIPDNQGRVSLLRNGREIYYEIIPRLFTGGVDQDIDRFIGVEVSFPATLDEYLQVRHVKRGAEPVSKLREKLREFLVRPVNEGRKRIRNVWDSTETVERNASDAHDSAHAAVKQAEQTSPQGKGGMSISLETATQIVNDLLADIKVNPDTDPEKAEEVKQKIQNLPITIFDGEWSGKELFEITHLNGKAIIKYNYRHPFFREIYVPIKDLAGQDPKEISAEDAIRLARKVEVAIDVLFMAYAKAENMHSDPDSIYDDLRSYWGLHANSYTREALRDK